MKPKALSQKRNQSLPKNKYDKVESRYKNLKKTTFDFDQQPNKLSRVSPHLFKLILQFAISNYSDAILLMKVSHRFFLELQCTSDVYCYLSSEITTEGCLKELRFKYLEKLLKTYTEFDDKMQCLFQYEATKMNLPDKTLDSLDLCAQVKINKSEYTPKVLFRKLNFASHLYFKVMMTDIKCSMKSDTYDEIVVNIKIKSTKLQVEVNYNYKYTAQVIRNQAIQGKAFNHMTDGNILFSFFEDDSSLLYLIFENSTMQLMHKFWTSIKRKNCWVQKKQILTHTLSTNKRSQSAQKSQIIAQSIQKDNSDDEDDGFIPIQQNKKQNQLPPIAPQQQRQQPNILKKRKVTTFLKPKRIEQKFQYSSLKEYVQDQQDFEIMINIHTGVKGENLFYFIDTKALPRVDKNAYFQYSLKEQINLNYRFYLDNRLGMKEVVENLFLCDIVMKDRDEFRIMYSGFIQIFESNINEIQHYNIAFLENASWKVFKLNQENFQVLIIFGVKPSVVKYFELQLSKI